MGVPSQSLDGIFEHKLDTKYRVSVPSSWRPASGETIALRLIKWKHLKVPVLRVMTKEAFSAVIKSIEESLELPVGTRNAQKQALFSRSIMVQLNDQGKMSIPKKNAEEFGITAGGTAHLFGRGQSFDIVAPANVEELHEREAAVLEDLYDTVDFG